MDISLLHVKSKVYTMSIKSAKTRNRILKTTWELLEGSNGAEVRMVDIAKAAGLSRQAVYLHFPTRSELLIATTIYLDEVKHVEDHLLASRTAESGIERLDAFIDWWGNYIPEIHGIAKALMVMQDTDEAAREAWNGRMQAVRHGCLAAINALKLDNVLTSDYTVKQATDILWTTLSVRTWEHYRHECGWSQKQYIKNIKNITHRIFIKTSN